MELLLVEVVEELAELGFGQRTSEKAVRDFNYPFDVILIQRSGLLLLVFHPRTQPVGERSGPGDCLLLSNRVAVNRESHVVVDWNHRRFFRKVNQPVEKPDVSPETGDSAERKVEALLSG